MKKIRILLAAILAVALLTSVLFISEAEPAVEAEWQADLLKLMDPADVPSTTHIQYENTYDEGINITQRDVACEVTVNDVTYGCEFVFEVVGDAEPDWSEIQKWLGGIVTESARTAGSDSESLAKAIDKAIRAARKSAQPDANGALPAWASESIQVSDIRVSTPFYPELELGKNGEATKRLQQSLIEMGFLNDRADGYFGERTKLAVEALESYVRELEQELIDARPVETPTPAPTATPVTTATAEATPESKHQLTLVPKNTPVPTEEPTLEPTMDPSTEPVEPAQTLEPVTQVDGVADALLQAYLYSDSFVSVRGALKSGSSSIDVTRLQTRLLNLGCSVSEPDGDYGSTTARAVRVFQYANGLSQTGVADEQTLALLFSANAKAPAHAMLSLGSTGDDVTALQQRLLYLGFTTASADGSFGTATETAVQRLQEYVRSIETLAVKAADPTIAADADVSDRLTTVVDGVADPILLDIFYSDSFPVVPGELGGGSSGDEVIRLQRRLSGLNFFNGTLDGSYGAVTREAVLAFQKQHKLSQTGTADADTLRVLFSGDAQKALKPYVLKVSTKDQRVYAYGLDDNNEYTVLVRTMKCSTGKDATPTPTGTFQSTTGPGARWHYFKKYQCWAQYAYYIEGDIMFHSVLYNEKDGPVTQSSVNNLGRKASHGCVRLSVEDAKWIYQNCPVQTKIIVY